MNDWKLNQSNQSLTIYVPSGNPQGWMAKINGPGTDYDLDRSFVKKKWQGCEYYIKSYGNYEYRNVSRDADNSGFFIFDKDGLHASTKDAIKSTFSDIKHEPPKQENDLAHLLGM
jgi:hypothetical protein